MPREDHIMPGVSQDRIVFPVVSLAFFTLLCLKVTGLVQISWLWVFSPYWLPVAGFVVAALIIGAIAGIVALGAVVYDWYLDRYSTPCKNIAKGCCCDQEPKRINGQPTNHKSQT